MILTVNGEVASKDPAAIEEAKKTGKSAPAE